jgi:hypothetical protein
VLMTMDDVPLLSRWLIYHGHVFGFEHLYVFDGSIGEQEAYLTRVAERFPIHVRHSLTNLNAISAELAAWMVEIKDRYEWIMKVDTDEFVAYAPGGALNVTSPRLHLPGGTSAVLMEVEWVFNVEPVESGSPTETERAQRVQAGSFKQIYSGSLFKIGLFNLGSHSTQHQTTAAAPGLAVVHYHDRTYEDMVRLAFQTIVSHGYIRATDSRTQMIEKLTLLDHRPRCTGSSCHKNWIVLDDLRDHNKTLTDYLARIGTAPPTLHDLRDYLREIFPMYPSLLRD